MSKLIAIPSVSVTYAQDGTSKRTNALGMRPMQEIAYQKRGEQYLLIKSPPASGKSRALMFIALDKLENQNLKQAIVVVPEKAIGASFHDEPLSQFGFWADWRVEPRWNLCNAPGTDGGKVEALKTFIDSDAKVLVCTHATFRFAVDKFGVEMLDNRLIAVDEFHHVSANPDNKLGDQIRQLMTRDKTHIVAMTGSYFRGDAEAVLHPEDEAKFHTVTYTYYEQLNGYEHLKQLDIGYYFYSGNYTDEIMQVLNPNEKTILHIPNVNSRESTKDKIREVEHIIEALGEWQGTDPNTGFQQVKTAEGKILKIADLVDDDPNKRDKVAGTLKDPKQKNNRHHVDIIIALGMAKEGFDWIWCEHALTVGYRSSLTEIVQIIGRATRDAPGKTSARFTNLIAEPDVSEMAVTEAINDTIKAIAASLLMEQVLAPRFEFKPKRPDNQPTPGFDYGESGYNPNGQKVLVAQMGEMFVSDYGRSDCRLRVIYDHGTESDLLLRSLQRALNKDKTSRRITKLDLGPLFSGQPEPEVKSDDDDLITGYIYVLRSLSDHPFIAKNRSIIHKIGVTGGDVKKRIANAKNDPTYLLADVEIVATFKLENINRKKLEAIFHKFFASAKLDLELTDRFNIPVKPREWFLVPLEVIETVIDKIQDGTIEQFRYDRETASLARFC